MRGLNYNYTEVLITDQLDLLPKDLTHQRETEGLFINVLSSKLSSIDNWYTEFHSVPIVRWSDFQSSENVEACRSDPLRI